MNIGEAAYWDERYKTEMAKLVKFELFDWYCPFSDLFHMMEGCFDSSVVHKVLIIGVGRSDVIEFLYRKGYRDIVAIDISNTIIVEMQKRYASYTGVEFFVMDAKQLMKFSAETFTLVLDKGCIDSLFCGTDYVQTVALTLGEVFRVLTPDGVFMCVSHGSKLSRIPYFRQILWALDCYRVPSDVGEHLSLYAMTKTKNPELLSRIVAGAEAVSVSKSQNVVSADDQNMNKGSTARSGANAGSITVNTSEEKMAALVNTSEEKMAALVNTSEEKMA
eukprot:CAMPEP_0173343290 /NCGR_PEP_ID=MMETSP1144-20121109/10715_1 /TAXON_ID=483371 /ORGANISM="non described non described, Strain CCMP2298" /LENGTH=275 /DNA_ID=CAMNT_0014290047 /DNA_START=281 /DNA_END=1105 /DNA_ORIENTATION=-